MSPALQWVRLVHVSHVTTLRVINDAVSHPMIPSSTFPEGTGYVSSRPFVCALPQASPSAQEVRLPLAAQPGEEGSCI